MSFTKWQFRRFTVILIIFAITVLMMVVACERALHNPPNLVWAVFRGYYRYDPRRQTPPDGLFRDRPQPARRSFFDATLERCQGRYPPLATARVTRYEVEAVEYFGHTDYHAFSHLHTRIYFADGTSVRAVFRFEAGHNAGYPLMLGAVTPIKAGGWMAVGSLLRDPSVPPPGWRTCDQDTQPFACNPGPPYQVE